MTWFPLLGMAICTLIAVLVTRKYLALLAEHTELKVMLTDSLAPVPAETAEEVSFAAVMHAERYVDTARAVLASGDCLEGLLMETFDAGRRFEAKPLH